MCNGFTSTVTLSNLFRRCGQFKKNAVVYIYIALCIDTVYTQECVMLQTKKLKSTTPIIVPVSFARRLFQSLLLSFRANSRRTHTCTCIHSHTGRLAGKQQYALFYHAISSFTLHSCVSTNNKLIQMRDCVRSGGENNKQIAKETAI